MSLNYRKSWNMRETLSQYLLTNSGLFEIVKMLQGTVRCSTLIRSFGLFIKVIHLTQQKGLYFEIDARTDRIAVEKLHFRIGGFLLYIRARFRCLNFQNWNVRVSARMHIPDIPSILDPFFSLQRFESIDLRPFYDSILNLLFFSFSFISIGKWISHVSISFRIKII